MNKTSEALREEIAEIIRESDCGALTLRYYGDAEEIIDKILDAVVESMLEYNGKDSKMNYLQVVNILRPSK